MKHTLHRIAAALLAVTLGFAPAWGKPPPYERVEGEAWFDWAGKRANQATALEARGLHGEADEAREEVLNALVLAWREESDARALDPIVKTLHQRLERSTSAVRVALRFIYELHEKKLTSAQETQLSRLQARIATALLRLKREAKPGDAGLCTEQVGLRLGELTLEGPLPTDPILVLRDVEGGLEVIECPIVEGLAPAPPAAMGDEPWWLMGGGLAVLAVSGVFFGLGYSAAQEKDDLIATFTPGGDNPNTEERFQAGLAGGRADALFVAGGVTAALGGVMALSGLIWGLARDGGNAEAEVGVAPSANGLSIFGRF